MYGESAFNLLLLSTVSTMVSCVTTNPPNPCPRRALRTAMGCTAMLGYLGQPSQLTEQNVAERLVDGCRYGTFLDAVNCIERVMNDCQQDTSDASVYLRSNINVGRARESINYFCTNVNVYVAHTECIKRHLGEVSNCSHGAKMNFMSQTKATSDRDVLLRSQCSFISKAMSCMTDIIENRCNKKAAEIVGKVMEGFEPPVCFRSTTSYGIIAETGMEDEQVGENIISEDNGNTASSLPCISFHFALALILWQHVIKALVS